MANLNGVNIVNGTVGPNVGAEDTSVSMLYYCSTNSDFTESFPAIQNEFVELTKLSDVETAGITAQTDVEHGEFLFRHVSEFYRIAGDGTKLYVAIRNDYKFQDILPATMGQSCFAKDALNKTDGDVRNVAFAFGSEPDSAFNGVYEGSLLSIPKAQIFAEWAEKQNKPIHILIECPVFQLQANSIPDFRDLTELVGDAPKVSVFGGQDFDFWDAQTTEYKLHCDVGTALGLMAKAAINQNIGDNEYLNVTNANQGNWKVPGIGGAKCSEIQEELQGFENNGLIFGLKYEGLAGVRMNGDHCCVPIVIDADGNMNEHSIALSRTTNEIKRSLRRAFIPKVKTRQPVDPATGKLPTGVVKYFDGLGDDVFSRFVLRNEISGGKTYTDPASDLLIAKQLNIQFKYVPYGNVGEINGLLNIKNKLD